jgi:hypothetical protein
VNRATLDPNVNHLPGAADHWPEDWATQQRRERAIETRLYGPAPSIMNAAPRNSAERIAQLSAAIEAARAAIDAYSDGREASEG